MRVRRLGPTGLIAGLVCASAVRVPAQAVLGTDAYLAPEAIGLPDVPGGVLLADITGDGVPDAIVADGGGGLLVLAATGSAGLLAPVSSPLAFVPPLGSVCLLRAGDLDGDGDLDLVLAQSNAPFTPMNVVYGDGHGAFGNGVVLTTSLASIADAALADLDGDGALDLALTGSFFVNSVTLRTGTGTGGFLPEQTLAWGLSAHPGWLAVAEVTGDAAPDLIVASSSFSGSNVLVLAGTGGGGFAAPAPLLPGVAATSLAVADLDADGRDDLIVLQATAVQVQYQSVAGSLGPAVTTDLGSQLPLSAEHHLALGDIDGNGVPDAVATAGLGPMLLLGTADHGFHAGAPFDLGDEARCLALADVDRDGRADVLFGRPSKSPPLTGGLLELARGDGQGGWLSAPHAVAPAAFLFGLASGDIDGDGLPDVVSRATDPDGLAVFRGAGKGALDAAVILPGLQPGLLADFDEDGRADLFTNGPSIPDPLELRLATGGLSFGAPTSWAAGPKPIVGAVADLDGDGHADVVATGAFGSDPTLRVLLGDGAGHLGAPVLTASTGLAGPLAFADINLDGQLDAVSCGASDILVFTGDGTGLLAAGQDVQVLGLGNAGLIATGDVDGNGSADVVAGTESSNGGVLVVVPNTAGVLGTPTKTIEPYFGGQALSLADMDDDGALDVVTASPSAGLVVVLHGDGHGAFPVTSLHHVLATAARPIVLDADGDGRLDVVAIDEGQEATVAVLRAAPTPWADLGFALAGAGTAPSLTGTGTLLPHSAGALDLVGAPANSAVSLFFGLQAGYQPFHGGTLVPAGDVRSVYPASVTGALHLAWQDFPVLPSGLVVYAQAWSADATAPGGLAASNALSATVP